MEEKNPLEPAPVTLSNMFLRGNARGRPTSDNARNFTPQPKSIISRLLRRVRKQKCDKIKKGKVNAYLNVSNSSSNTDAENDVNSKNDRIHEQLEITNKCLNIQGNYAVELENDHDKNTLGAEEINNVQSNTTTFRTQKCEEPKLPVIACYVCSHRSSNQEAHRKHLSTHRNQPYACNFPDCKYTCKLSCNLIKHKRIHTSEKPFLCDQCTFRSNFVNSLKVHKRIHTSERPYGCKLCSYRCNSSSNLKKHCRHKHRNIS